MPKPDVVIVTDIHPDHFSLETIQAGYAGGVIVAPQAVYDKLTDTLKSHSVVLKNGESRMVAGANFEAVPMYNTTAERLQYHDKGRGNGYVVSIGGKRLYIAGDTEDIPEMRALKDIDVAFVPMNLPYTMTVEQAADAVKAFKAKVVYPYHFRGSDVAKFKALVGTDSGTEVRLAKWY
jgi:L-ascorbate metabolism protein UlaG (beta-lactamase superfamily)